MGIFTGIANDGGGGGSSGTTINEDHATYVAALSHARNNPSLGAAYRLTGSGQDFRYTTLGAGYLVPAALYGALDGLLTNASGSCYYDTGTDTLAAITARGFAAAVNGTSSVTQPGGAGNPLVIAASSGGSNYVYWNFVPTTAKPACLMLMRVDNDTTPGAASAILQSNPKSGSSADGVISLADGAGEPWWTGNSSSGTKLATQDGTADTGLLDGTKWVLAVHGGTSTGYWIMGGDGDLAARATADRQALQNTSGPLIRVFAWGTSGAASFDVHEFVAIALNV